VADLKIFGRDIDPLVQIGGLLVAVITLAVTVIFSLRSENVKDLSIVYLPKRPLMSMEAGAATAGLEVRYGNAHIDSPWLISGKLQNTGNLPIEEHDIEVPARMRFGGGRVVGAEVTQRSQVGLFGRVNVDGNDVVFTHKLLNPGDWIGFDIIFDGEPGLPVASSRISGIRSVRLRTAQSGDARQFPALLPLPTPAIYCMLTIGSLGALIIIGGGLALVGFVVKRAFLYRKSLNEEIESRKEKADRAFSRAHVLTELRPSSPNASALFEVVRGRVEFRDLDDASSLRAVISGHVPGTLLDTLRLDVDDAANLLRKELTDSVRNYVYYSVYDFAPCRGSKRDNYIDKLMAGIDRLSASDLLERAKGLAVQPEEQPKVYRDDLLLAAIILSFGVSLFLLLGGTWRTVLTYWV
jgi:hypothetical protein